MPTLKQRIVASGYQALAAQPGEVVRADKRTRGFETFQSLTNPRQFRVCGGGPLHYDVGGEWADIDLTVRLTPGEAWDAACETNGYQVRFWQAGYRAQFRRAGASLTMAPLALAWENSTGERQLVGRPKPGIKAVIDAEADTVTWPDAFGKGLHWRYHLRPDQFYGTVVVDSKASLPVPTIGKTGLRLTKVLALTWAGAKPETFASAVTVADLTTEDSPTAKADEELEDPGEFPHLTADARQAFWVRHPRAWDSDPEHEHEFPTKFRLQRRGTQVLGLVSVTAASVNAASYPLYLDTDMAEEQVASSTDDAYSSTTTTYLDATTINLQNSLGTRYAGARFTSVPLPQGATIDSAAMVVYQQYASSNNDVNTVLYCEDADDTVTFASDNGPKDRARTTASVAWVQADISGADWHNSPDIATCVQEVVDRVGWATGNDLCVLTMAGMTADSYIIRTYDYAGNTSGPKFNCSYTTGAQTTSAADTATATDTASTNAHYPESAADSATATDTASTGAAYSETASDSVTATDSATTGTAYPHSVVDSVAATDLASTTALYPFPTATDLATLTDLATWTIVTAQGPGTIRYRRVVIDLRSRALVLDARSRDLTIDARSRRLVVS